MATPPQTTARHRILYDTDPGVDDAMALVFLARHPDVALAGLTSVFGNHNLETTTRNARWLAGRFAPGVPVARGAAASLRGHAPEPLGWIHGDNGLGNITLDPTPQAPLDPRPAHQFIIDTVRASPGAITLVAVGPLTNLALALQADPGIAPLVRQVVVMGGAFGFGGVLGNVTPAAEANIAADPDAADAVFGADWTVTIAGLDVTQKTVMSTQYLQNLADQGGATGQFLRAVSRHYEAFHLQSAGLQGIYTHDSSAVACVVAPELYTMRQGPVRVLTDGIATGQTIQKPSGHPVPNPAWDNRRPARVCVEVDTDGFLALFARTVCRVG